ncbi:transcriptional regulator [Robbsia sp. KACC 23696]|uniref:transcriptional regulator n=1 Tax=Robbsia sp. KACC 23696 TaxID=3149231 RepID=UPI00325BBAD8
MSVASGWTGEWMATTKRIVQTQQDFLLAAMGTLGMTRDEFAKRLSVGDRTLEKWLAPADGPDFTTLPDIVWNFVREILAWSEKKS